MSDGAFRLATSTDGQTWDNPDLVNELRDAPEAGSWSVWNWSQSERSWSPLQITVGVPQDHGGSLVACHEFLDAVGRQLSRAFGLFCSERGWPLPGYRMCHTASSDQNWFYHITLPGGPDARGVLKPTKLLVMGDESQLSSLLGLETADPILGLPAKWIARSQLGTAHSARLHLFDGPGLVAAHTLHVLGEIWHRSLGFLEIQRWLLSALPGHSPLLAAVAPENTGLLLRTVRELIAEGLWLPHPAAFLELFVSTLPELEPDALTDADLLKELMRKEIVPLNLKRFTDHEAMLHAVEWRGEPEGDSADQARLIHRLGAALLLAHEFGGCPVVITDFENRLALSQALRAPFPYLPVLSWAELPAHARLNLVAVVDAKFEVDPSPWTHATYEVAMPPRCTAEM